MQNRAKDLCPVAKKCGGCQYQGVPYEKQLQEKEKTVKKLFKGICPVHSIKGMKEPYHYRNKVHAVFDRDRRGNIISAFTRWAVTGSFLWKPAGSRIRRRTKSSERSGAC